MEQEEQEREEKRKAKKKEKTFSGLVAFDFNISKPKNKPENFRTDEAWK